MIRFAGQAVGGPLSSNVSHHTPINISRSMASTSRLLAPLGWALSAASLLNLVQDLSKGAIKSKVADWLNAYDTFVRTVGNFLFSWIDWRWISITTTELHVLVLTSILCATLSRSWLVNDGEPSAVVRRNNALGAWGVWLLAFASCILLPDRPGWPIGAIAGVVWLALAALVTFVSCDASERGIYPPCKIARREAIGVLACVVVLLVVGQLATQVASDG